MKLYFAPSACSFAPHIVLNELGLDHTIEKVDLGSKKTGSGDDFTAINGKGYVPTLDTGKDGVLTEVAAILQYLADNNASKNLLPKFGGMERYRAMEMLNFIASELHKGIGSLFNKAFNDEAKTAIHERLDKRIGWLDAQLAKNPYLLSKDFSVADAYAFTVLNWGQWVGYDVNKHGNVKAFMERVAARPAVQKTFAAEAA
jgi:glutathione S-transferase